MPCRSRVITGHAWECQPSGSFSLMLKRPVLPRLTFNSPPLCCLSIFILVMKEDGGNPACRIKSRFLNHGFRGLVRDYLAPLLKHHMAGDRSQSKVANLRVLSKQTEGERKSRKRTQPPRIYFLQSISSSLAQ